MKPFSILWTALSVLLLSQAASAQVTVQQNSGTVSRTDQNRERVRREFRQDLDRSRLSRDEKRLIDLRRLQDRGYSRNRSAAPQSAPVNGNRQPSGTVRTQ